MSRSRARVKLFIKFIDSPYEYRIFAVTFGNHQWTRDLYSAEDGESRTICQISVCEKQLNFKYNVALMSIDLSKLSLIGNALPILQFAGAILGGLIWNLFFRFLIFFFINGDLPPYKSVYDLQKAEEMLMNLHK